MTITDQSRASRPTDAAPSAGPAPRWLRAGALALLVGGPLSFVFHILWQLGHGPTVINEHGVVLGLTNDQWSYLSGAWRLPVAFGVVVVCSLYAGRLGTVAKVLTLAGLALGAAAAWIFVVFSVAALALYGGIACLAVMILRGGVLPRWSAAALLVPVVGFLPLVFAPDAVVGASTGTVPLLAQSEDLLALAAAMGWTLLGCALVAHGRVRRACSLAE